MKRILVISSQGPDPKFAAWEVSKGIIRMLQSMNDSAEIFIWFPLVNENISEDNDDFLDETKYSIIARCVPINIIRMKSLFGSLHKVKIFLPDFVKVFHDLLDYFSPDVLLFTSLEAASFVLTKDLKKTNCVVIEQNIEYFVFEELSKFEKKLGRRIYYKFQEIYTRKLEKKILERCSSIITLSNSDSKRLIDEYKVSPRKVFTIRPLVKYKTGIYNKTIQESTISFIGSMNWYPNIYGVRFFINEVLNRLLKKIPELKFYIIGRNPPKEFYNLTHQYSDKIVVTGAVKDISEYYKNSQCIVIPVFHGPGIKLKVLEAMASGVPTVMTSYVAKDYDLLDKGFCIADTPEEFVEHISKVLTDSEFANEISKRQVQWYENYLISERRHAEEVIKTILFSDSKNENN